MGQSLGQGLGSKFGAIVRSLGQSLRPESGSNEFRVRVWDRVGHQSLEFGSKFGASVWSLGQSFAPESGVWSEFGSEVGARVWRLGRSLGQSLRPEFGARVWSLGSESESESRHPKPNPEMVWVGVWSRVLALGFGPGFGTEFGAGSKFGVRVWGMGQSLGLARVGSQSLGQSLGAQFDSECGIKLN